FLLPFKMLKEAPNKVLAQNKFQERVPTKSIVFNEANFDEYALYTGISPNNALFTGVPFFDRFCKADTVEMDHVVYIDHPYLEERILGWNVIYHRQVAKCLFDFAEQRKIKIYI